MLDFKTLKKRLILILLCEPLEDGIADIAEKFGSLFFSKIIPTIDMGDFRSLSVRLFSVLNLAENF